LGAAITFVTLPLHHRKEDVTQRTGNNLTNMKKQYEHDTKNSKNMRPLQEHCAEVNRTEMAMNNGPSMNETGLFDLPMEVLAIIIGMQSMDGQCIAYMQQKAKSVHRHRFFYTCKTAHALLNREKNARFLDAVAKQSALTYQENLDVHHRWERALLERLHREAEMRCRPTFRNYDW
jgi:hypothetical protein